MKNIKKWIIGGLIIGIVSGAGISIVTNNNTVDTNAVDTVACVSDINSSEEYTMDVVYTTDWLRVRTNPSFDADIVDVFSPDTAVMRIATLDNGWSKVIYNEEIKYMHSDYLSETAIDYPVDENDIDNTDDTVEDNDCITDTDVYYDCNNEVYYESNYCNADYTAEEFQELGVISWGMYRYTWYSELVLTGEGLDIEGRHTDENGFVCDVDNYICVASDSLDRGTIVDTPFGKQGKVYDCGCGSNDIIDCYVSW